MICPNCRNPIPGNIRFCPLCGFNLTQIAVNPLPSPKKPHWLIKKRLITTIAFILLITFSVQIFFFPGFVNTVSFGKISTLFLKRADPGKELPKQLSSIESISLKLFAANQLSSAWFQLNNKEKNILRAVTNALNVPGQKERQDALLKITGMSLSSGSLSTSTRFISLHSPIINLSLDTSSPTPKPSSPPELKPYADTNALMSDISTLATMFTELGYYNIALALSAQAAEKLPLDPGLLNTMGCALKELGRLNDAYQILSVAYRLQPGDVNIIVNLGNTAMDMYDLELASDWFDLAIAIDPECGLAYEGMMIYYMSKKDYTVAMRHMLKAARYNFTSNVALTNDVLHNLENYDDIAEQVLGNLAMSDIFNIYAYGRKIDAGGVTPLKIPKLPAFYNAEAHIQHTGDILDYSQEIAQNFMTALQDTGKLIESSLGILESLGNGNIMDSIKSIGSTFFKNSSVNSSDGVIYARLSCSKELVVSQLLSDYYDVRTKDIKDELSKGIEKAGNVWEDLGDQSSSDLKAYYQGLEAKMEALETGGSAQEILAKANDMAGYMNPRLNNSLMLSGGTIASNKGKIGSHLNLFYGALVTSYNQIDPLLKDYWLYTGAIIQNTGDEAANRSLNVTRKFKVAGELGVYAFAVGSEAVIIPMVYGMTAITGGENSDQIQKEAREKETLKLEEEKAKAEAIAKMEVELELGPAKVKLNNEAIEAEVNSLVYLNVEKNFKASTTTVAGGIGGELDVAVAKVGGSNAAYVSMDRNYQVVDYGFRFKQSAGASTGFGTGFEIEKTQKYSIVKSVWEKTAERCITQGVGPVTGKMKTEKSY